jgi:hypothetical protein
MLGICRGSCFIAELKFHYEKFKSDPLIYTSARRCGCTSLDETAFRAATAGHTVEGSVRLYYVMRHM